MRLFIVLLLLTTLLSLPTYGKLLTAVNVEHQIHHLNTINKLISYRARINNRGGISAKQAANIAQRSYGGKVLKIQRNGANYRVKLLKKNGHIIWVRVDAKTGAVQ